MKRLIFIATMALASAPAFAQSQIDVASFTPPQMSGMKWIKLGESSTDAFWYAYATTGDIHYIAIKDAVKGIGDAYSALFVTFANLHCGPKGHYPQALEQTHTDAYDLIHGWPLTQGSPIGDEVPLVRGTAAAEAVIRSCDAIAATTKHVAPPNHANEPDTVLN